MNIRSKKIIFPLLACIGFLFAIFMIFFGLKKTKVSKIEFSPSIPPYEYYVAGMGIVEAFSKNITIGTPFTNIVKEIFIKEGDEIQKGMPLFKLDISTLKAEFKQLEAKKEVAIAIYKKLLAESRIETVYPLKDKTRKAFNIYEDERTILQINISLGELVQNRFEEIRSAILFGILDPMHVRIEVDEEDAWRIEKGMEAMAYVCGNSKISFPLEFIRIDPFIIPKRAFTGDTTEMIDTRVLEIIYKFKKKLYLSRTNC